MGRALRALEVNFIKEGWLLVTESASQSRPRKEEGDLEVFSSLISTKGMEWSGKRESDPQNPAWKAGSLPLALFPQLAAFL